MEMRLRAVSFINHEPVAQMKPELFQIDSFLLRTGFGLLVLVGAFGNTSTTTPHPGGAGAEPVVVPTEPDPVPQTGTLVE